MEEGRLVVRVCQRGPQSVSGGGGRGGGGQEPFSVYPLRPSFFFLFQSLELFITSTRLLGGFRAHWKNYNLLLLILFVCPAPPPIRLSVLCDKDKGLLFTVVVPELSMVFVVWQVLRKHFLNGCMTEGVSK